MPKSKTYEEFVEKFRPKKTTDDCFTPENVYAVVRDWAVKKYHVTGEIVRPFWPGEDYTKAEYPVGCCVIDNPPFSICKMIVDWYNAHGVRFFLFCPGLTSLCMTRDGKTTFVSCGNTITFANGARINVAFLTNMGGDVLCETAHDLHDLIKKTNDENEKVQKKHVTKYRHADCVLTAGRLKYLTVHHTPFKVLRNRAAFVRRLDCGTDLFGGGFLLADGDALAAAERAAAERAAAHVIELSDREKAIIRSLANPVNPVNPVERNMPKTREFDTTTARRKACGYRINWTCANCVNCYRSFDNGSVNGTCRLHDFPVNIARGICNHFDNIAKY